MPQKRSVAGIESRTDAYTIKASGAETANTTGAQTEVLSGSTVYIEVNITAASGTSPTMTVVIEGSWDGTNWYTIGTFGANGYNAGSVATAPSNFTTTAGPIGGFLPCPQFIRSRSVIGGTTPSFTYSVTAVVD